MASVVAYLPHLFLLFLASSSLRTNARESLFFSKATRHEAADEPATAPAPATGMEEPATLPTQSHNGYGLYGRGPDRFSPPTTTNHGNDIPSSFSNMEFTTESYGNKESDARYRTFNNENNNANSIPSTFAGDGFNSGRYGMSDTRFLENGKYFYDVNAERDGNGYESTGRDPEGYGSYNGAGGYGGYSYGGNKNGYDNTMEGYQNSQEEYVP